MFSKFTAPNRFGKSTWEIKINSIFRFLIDDTGKEYVVYFQEFILFYRKDRFTFISKKNFSETIKDAFDKAYEYFLQKPEYIWTIEKKAKLLQTVLSYIDESDYRQGESPKQKMQTKYQQIVNFWFKDKPIGDIIERENELELILYSEDKTSKTNYLVKEIRNQLNITFVQINELGEFPMEWNYPIGVSQYVILDDLSTFIRKTISEIKMKKVNDLLDDFYNY